MAMDRVREEIEFVLARHGMPASRDRIAMGVLINHICEGMYRRLATEIARTQQKMGAEQSQSIPRIRQDDVLSWTESLSSSQSVPWAYDSSVGHDTVDAYTFAQERLTSHPDSPVCTLSLAFEDLTSLAGGKIPDELFNTVRTLDLSNNRFKNIQFLSEFESLTTIILDHNRVDCLTTFPKIPKLHTLSINFNRILSPTPFIPSLALQCPNLRILSLMGNEVCPNYLNGGTEQQNELYRHFVIKHFPKLEHLDDCSITPLERERALASTGVVQGYQCSLDEGIDTE